MAFSMTFQPPQLDSPITTVWDLAQFNVALQGGILQSGMMVLNCYSSEDNIGNNAKILFQKSYALNAAGISNFQSANNLQPGQIAQFAYGLAQSIQDVVVTPASGSTPAVMTSFFVGATVV